jgi:uncharacterized protein (DUF433 family)
MTGAAELLVGRGIYSVPEAARLSRVPAARIRRWIRGYSFRSRSGVRASPPAFHGDLVPIRGALALSFLDLVEVRFVDAFLRAGVRWPTLRLAHAQASRLIGTDHPFCTNKFCTDGRRIFADMPKLRDEPGLVEVLRKQHYFEAIVRPLLVGLEFTPEDMLLRWWPLGAKRAVVLDPRRGFGAPIVDREGVPTNVLVHALNAGNTREEVRSWFQVSAASLRDAEEFEQTRAA